MEYRTKSGYVLTEEEIEKLARACERGDYPGASGEFVITPISSLPNGKEAPASTARASVAEKELVAHQPNPSAK